MHEILNTFEEINLDLHEYCILVENKQHSSQSFPMYVPKLMAGIPIMPKASWVEGVGDVYANAKECKVSFSKTVSLQNFLTIPRHFHTDFSYRASKSGGIIKKGVRFICHSMYGNPKDLRIERVV